MGPLFRGSSNAHPVFAVGSKLNQSSLLFSIATNRRVAIAFAHKVFSSLCKQLVNSFDVPHVQNGQHAQCNENSNSSKKTAASKETAVFRELTIFARARLSRR